MWIRQNVAEEENVVGAYVQTSLGPLHYRTVPGRENASPLIMLHQSPLSSAQYRRTLPLFCSALRPMAFDTPGHGSSATPTSEWEIADYAQCLWEAVSSLGLEKTALFGRATGATIAVEMARQAPDRVTALALHGLPVYRDEERAQRLESFAPPLELSTSGSHVVHVWERIMDQYPELEPELATQFLIDYLSSGPDYARAYRAVFRYDMPTAFRDVKSPVRVWFGEQDRLSYMSRRQAELDPPVEVRTFPAQDDFVAWRDPRLFADEVESFVREATGDA